ncbi:MAG TPA: pre-peptidase C-terminal domain-containing protein [Candidatus Limnocylindrales bacterium]|nr:pre-peptidase C-terminal domain-containing protein [Candidatus Limnocylindrales bacterium]
MRLITRIACHRAAAGLSMAAAMLFAGCAPAPEVIVLAPTQTLQGAVVPTRAPTLAPSLAAIPPTTAASSTPTEKATDAPTVAPSSTTTPTAGATNTATLPPSVTPGASATATLTPSAPTNSPVVPTVTWTPSPLAPSSTPAPVTTGLTVGSQTVALSDGLTVGSATTGAIDDATPWLVYPLSAQSGDVLDLKLDASSGGLQPVLHVLNPAGEEIARSAGADSSGLTTVRGIEFAQSADYFVVVTREGAADGAILNASSGPFELSVSTGNSGTQAGIFSLPIAYGQLETTTINASNPMQLFTFTGSAGEIITIQTIGINTDLDTWLELSDSLGNVIARNDDDPLRPTLDSAIYDFVLPTTGPYSIAISRYSGSDASGDFQIKFTRTGQISDDSRQALLDYGNSVTLLDNLTPITDFRAGDQLTTDGQEIRSQSLLTFHLPNLPVGVTVGQAVLDLHVCTEIGAGFVGLGTLNVYADSYGDLNVPRDFTRPAAGARIITEADACGPLDITEAVAAAYAEGRNEIQLRLTFRTANNNQQVDEIRFEPRLTITPAG